MSFVWYLNRLRSMSLAELGYRMVEKLKKEQARNRMEGWRRYEALPVEALPGLRERVLDAPAQIRAEIALAAETVLAGRFAALGVAWPQREPADLFPDSLWRFDPVSGQLWSSEDAYCFDIRYRHERRLGDVKYIWEINRLQFLQPLAAQALLTGDRNSLVAIEAAITSWHDANPPFRGLGWSSGIELALRAISILVVVSLVGEQISSQTRDVIGRVLHAHAVWLRRYPSRFSSANNHRVAELAGTFLLGLTVPDLFGAATMVDHARTGLIAELDKQILADGVPAEQSPSYGAFTAEFMLLVAVVARDSGRAFPDSVSRRLAAFMEFIGWIALDDGSVPAFGDDDDGRVLTSGVVEHAYPASVARAIGGYVGQSTSLPAINDFRGLVLGGVFTFAEKPSGRRIFTDGGYSVVNEEIAGHRVSLLFDHGPLGYLSIAAHGHADALSVTLALDGKPVLVDPGTYLYHSGGAWRDWFRGTAAHNTLRLGKADQSLISGAFNWSHKARCQLDRQADGAGWMRSAGHDGYRQRFGVVHQRRIERNGTKYHITDSLVDCKVAREAEVSFQLAADLSARIDGCDVSILRDDQTILVMTFETPALHIERGGNGIGGGWVSPCFGVKLAADRIVWSGSVGATGRLVILSIPASTLLMDQIGTEEVVL